MAAVALIFAAVGIVVAIILYRSSRASSALQIDDSAESPPSTHGNRQSSIDSSSVVLAQVSSSKPRRDPMALYEENVRKAAAAEKAAKYKGRHYTTYIEEIKELKREEDYDKAEKMLLGLIDAVERESEVLKQAMAPYYFEQLAIVYRKQKRYFDEVKILERYISATNALGYNETKFDERLEKAKLLSNKSKAEA